MPLEVYTVNVTTAMSKMSTKIESHGTVDRTPRETYGSGPVILRIG